jgi:predicted TIM-barrel fold metal-dependent hydrolase
VTRTYRIISADSHLDLAPDRWTHRIPAKWRDRAPRRVKLENGADGVVIENRPVHRLTVARMGGMSASEAREEHKRVPTFETHAGSGSPEQRLHEQDQDEVDAEILFTHSAHTSFWRGIREDEGFRALVHAYNEFLAEEYCAHAPDRLIAIGVIPPTCLDDALAELEYCTQAGLRGVALYRYPSGKGYPTPEDDRFWAAALERRMPITSHTNGGGTRFTNEGPTFLYPHPPANDGGVLSRDPISVEFFRFCGDAAFAPIQLAFAGVFDRFPELQIYWAETQVGWLPFALWQIDDHCERYLPLIRQRWGLSALERRPSDYLRTQNLWGFLYDPVGVRLRHDAGPQSLLWGSDFAHVASNWPRSGQIIDEMFAGVPDDERDLMVAGNAIRFFHLDEA